MPVKQLIVQRCDTEGIAQCSMSTATPDASMPPSGNYLLSIALAAASARATLNKTTMKQCTNSAGHFDGRGGVPVRYRTHHLKEEVHDFTRSHWTLPSGKQLLQ
jgi:hypothetical protein